MHTAPWRPYAGPRPGHGSNRCEADAISLKRIPESVNQRGENSQIPLQGLGTRGCTEKPQVRCGTQQFEYVQLYLYANSLLIYFLCVSIHILLQSVYPNTSDLTVVGLVNPPLNGLDSGARPSKPSTQWTCIDLRLLSSLTSYTLT